MQRYQCHKVVEAGRIADFLDREGIRGKTTLLLEGGETVEVDDAWWNRCKATDPGAADVGYFVRYSDGYESWSPTKVFEDGYTLIVPSTQRKGFTLTLVYNDGRKETVPLMMLELTTDQGPAAHYLAASDIVDVVLEDVERLEVRHGRQI